MVADKKKKINTDTAHGLVGHINDVDGQKIVKRLGFDLTRKSMLPCGACAEAKAKQLCLLTRTEVIKVEVRPRSIAKVANGRIYIDLSSVNKPKVIDVNITKPNWVMMVDERTGMK